jgi:hypothetical protein
MFILCVWPLLFFAGGVYYARFGLPVTLRWRGIGRIDDEEDL